MNYYEDGDDITKTFFREPPVTIQYPEVKRPVRNRFKGRHELKRYDNGLEKCIGCALVRGGLSG